MPPYSLDDVMVSYRWLGHRSYTELNALHRDYQPGKENAEWNAKHNLFPKIQYARSEREIVQFIKRFHPYHMLCYGINSRPRIFTTHDGRIRSARETEIESSHNLVLDFDFIGKALGFDFITKQPSDAHRRALEDFLNKADHYFLDLRLKAPVRAYTGRGYHLLFAFPEIKVSGCLDIAARIKAFCGQFRDAYRYELATLETKLDSTHDLRRMVRIYGTAKPMVGIISRFLGDERVEDAGLESYLRQMRISATTTPADVALGHGSALPGWFTELLKADTTINDMWLGIGKPENTDTSRSGYDYSIMTCLVQRGYKDSKELATILQQRPEGSVKQSHKGSLYVKTTVRNVLARFGSR